MNSRTQRESRNPVRRLKRLALAMGLLLLLFHTVGEAFHWRTHVPTGSLAPVTAQIATTSGAHWKATARTVPLLGDDCALCFLNGLLAFLTVAPLLALLLRSSEAMLNVVLRMHSGAGTRQRAASRAPPAFT